MQNQVVYILRCQQFYKIGYTTNLEQRVATLQVGNPFQIEVHKTFSVVNQKAESALQRKFKDYKERGEWYSLIFHEGYFSEDLILENFDKRIVELKDQIKFFEKRLRQRRGPHIITEIEITDTGERIKRRVKVDDRDIGMVKWVQSRNTIEIKFLEYYLKKIIKKTKR